MDPRTGLSPAAAGLSMPFRSHLPLSLDGGSGAPTAPGPATPAPQRRQACARAQVWARPAFARRYSRDLG